MYDYILNIHKKYFVFEYLKTCLADIYITPIIDMIT